MSATFSLSDLQAAQPYWYERIPYTFVETGVAPGTAAPLFSVRGWNSRTSPEYLVTVDRLAVDPWPGVWAQAAVDQQVHRVHVNDLRYGATETAWAATSNLSLSLLNQTASVPNGPGPGGLTIPVLRGRYSMTVWHMPAFAKVLRGIPLTAQETNYMTALGFSVNPADQRGWHPTPISAAIERTYANRQIAPPVVYAESVVPTSSEEAVVTVPAGPNQLLVLRRLAAVAPVDAGVTVRVDRDSTADHVVLAADQIGRDGVDCFIPALQHLTLKVQATNPGVTPVPLRMTVWTLSLSNVLRARLGVLQEADLQRIMGTTAGTKFWEDVVVGVN